MPIAAALKVEVTGYDRRDRWRPIDLSPKNYYEDFESCEGNGWDHPGCDGDDGPTTKGFIIDGVVYGATLMRTGNSALYDSEFWRMEPLLGECGLWEPIAFSVPAKPRRPEGKCSDGYYYN
jgi:hypothetical protein